MRLQNIADKTRYFNDKSFEMEISHSQNVERVMGRLHSVERKIEDKIIYNKEQIHEVTR